MASKKVVPLQARAIASKSGGAVTKRHSLPDILAIAICAVICGADGWAQVAEFGRCKLKWFGTFLELPNGIPSHDTVGRVFAALDPSAFEECFMKWVSDLATASAGRLIAIDGKTIRRSLDTANGKAAIHMVKAWCAANHMVLGQLATDAKSNEITAIPKLLELLDLNGAVVTIDAAGCQKKIAEQIVDQGGHYILQLKGNQGSLHNETVMLFDQCLTDDCRSISYSTAATTNGGHGRIEQRRIWATSEVNWFAEKDKWKNLRCLQPGLKAWPRPPLTRGQSPVNGTETSSSGRPACQLPPQSYSQA